MKRIGNFFSFALFCLPSIAYIIAYMLPNVKLKISFPVLMVVLMFYNLAVGFFYGWIFSRKEIEDLADEIDKLNEKLQKLEQ
ncbi:hypothetical protein SAMN02745116_02344 [Pilibacter termitis]|uniref:Uncharacterized protein n=2 Tax=Pilibacter termitis TaxID=263852 RepID=A0A1T4QX12_9ENTE|nr:hypothetical protein SAMN02745116_02344 [Pilibacter termitis]